MSQVKIYGLASHLNPLKSRLSAVIHQCLIDALQYPPEKKFQRFFPLQPEDFYYPSSRTEKYTIIEISMFEGRSEASRKLLIRLLIERIPRDLEIEPADLEITIFETPRQNRGIRGLPGDEIELNYNVEI